MAGRNGQSQRADGASTAMKNWRKCSGQAAERKWVRLKVSVRRGVSPHFFRGEGREVAEKAAGLTPAPSVPDTFNHTQVMGKPFSDQTTVIEAAKAAMRQQVRGRLSRMPPALQAQDSAKARELLKRQPLWNEARSILFFAPLPGEPDVWPLLAEALGEGKETALPRFDGERLCYTICAVRNLSRDITGGRFEIREPAAHCATFPRNRLDLLLVPGIAFDPQGHRLGRGKGYYDRLLAALSGERCGVGFDEQIVGEIPLASHDQAMNWILTPTRWLRASAGPGQRSA
jgi:5-formyltetrahydrofolate cyclo-ligase